jgi:hypothetical protein
MKIKQRRLFFMRAAKALEALHLHGWIAVILSATLLFGCTSLTPERVNVLAAIAGQAAAMGAEEWLLKHPQHRAAFDAVIAELVAVHKNGNTNEQALEDAFVERMSSLPTDTFRGRDGELYLTGERKDGGARGGLVVWDAQLKKSVPVRGEATRPVLKATLVGLKRAMVPKPPAPVVARARKVTDLEGREPESGLPPEIMPRSNAHLSPLRPLTGVTNLPAVGTRTNVINSILDISTNSSGLVPLLSVRWVQTPGSVYHIEHRDPQSPLSTNWYRFATVTNASGVGATNWATPWHPSIPAGAWRVVRSR